MCAHNENCGFMRTYILSDIVSEKKVSLKKILTQGWIKETLSQDVLHHFIYLYFSTTVRQLLPCMIKGVDISEQLYRQLLIYH